MNWFNPLFNDNKGESLTCVGITNDSMSFQRINSKFEFEIPVGSHVGSFGYTRRHDVHKGVDLYCPVGTDIAPVEAGKVVDIRPFTGPILGHTWWHNTWAISVEGETGVVVYGEIEVNPTLKIGDVVDEGYLLGHVLQVLTVDKGRPMAMLHIALHRHGVLRNGVWEVGTPQPSGLIDPTNHLIRGLL